MMPSAPEAMAFSMKRLPSVVPPRIATKTAPGRTRRESYSMPVMSASDAPAEPSEAEIKNNPRARSARLRIAEKV